eukprot:5749463-Prymnesium_polylepis.1
MSAHVWVRSAPTAPLVGAHVRVWACAVRACACVDEARLALGMALGMAMLRFIVWQWNRVGLELPAEWKKEVLRFTSPWSPPPPPSSPPCCCPAGLPVLQRSCCLP